MGLGEACSQLGLASGWLQAEFVYLHGRRKQVAMQDFEWDMAQSKDLLSYQTLWRIQNKSDKNSKAISFHVGADFG